MNEAKKDIGFTIVCFFFSFIFVFLLLSVTRIKYKKFTLIINLTSRIVSGSKLDLVVTFGRSFFKIVLTFLGIWENLMNNRKQNKYGKIGFGNIDFFFSS